MKRSKKIQRALEARVKDYFLMTSKPRTDNWRGYKKPGAKTGNPK